MRTSGRFLFRRAPHLASCSAKFMRGAPPFRLARHARHADRAVLSQIVMSANKEAVIAEKEWSCRSAHPLTQSAASTKPAVMCHPKSWEICRGVADGGPALWLPDLARRCW